jgi:hypothetical protein
VGSHRAAHSILGERTIRSLSHGGMERPVKRVCKDCGAQMVQDFFGDWFCDECEAEKMKNPPKLQLLIALLSILAFAIGYALDRE